MDALGFAGILLDGPLHGTTRPRHVFNGPRNYNWRFQPLDTHHEPLPPPIHTTNHTKNPAGFAGDLRRCSGELPAFHAGAIGCATLSRGCQARHPASARRPKYRDQRRGRAAFSRFTNPGCQQHAGDVRPVNRAKSGRELHARHLGLGASSLDFERPGGPPGARRI